MLHVGNIYLHELPKFMVNVGKYYIHETYGVGKYSAINIFYENRESNQRASNQRCEKINNDKHKLKKYVTKKKMKTHMSQNNGK